MWFRVTPYSAAMIDARLLSALIAITSSFDKTALPLRSPLKPRLSVFPAVADFHRLPVLMAPTTPMEMQ
jgi:hypothetical protein